jgi:hypothetical protein
MPSNYEKHLTRIRTESCHREELYRVRYSSGLPATALQLAQRWRLALSCEPLDWVELSAIREEASKMIVDVAFFKFINELERDYSLLRQAELETR